MRAPRPRGRLTLHGVTRDVTLARDGQLVNGQGVVVGATEIPFADYSIAQPRSVAVLTAESRGGWSCS